MRVLLKLVIIMLLVLCSFTLFGEEVKDDTTAAEYDSDGYLFSWKADSPPGVIVDFNLNEYYPEEALKSDIKSYTVTLLLKIDEKGALVSATVVSGEAPYAFNEHALEAVKRMRFSPGYKNGKPVKMALYFPVRFVLEDSGKPPMKGCLSVMFLQ